MLDKAPSHRPTAIEARRRMYRLATEIAHANSEFDLYEITTEPWAPMALPRAAESTARSVALDASPTEPRLRVRAGPPHCPPESLRGPVTR
jgi:hypothetical protein